MSSTHSAHNIPTTSEHTKSNYVASNFVDQSSISKVSNSDNAVQSSVPKQTANPLESEQRRVQMLREELTGILEQKALLEEQINALRKGTVV